jgi:hypothetical protein
MADAVELFHLKGLVVVQRYKSLGWYGISNLACCWAESFIKRLVHRLDHTKRLWVALTFLNKYVALSVSGAGASASLKRWAVALPRRRALPMRKKAWKQWNWLSMEKPAPTTVVYTRRRTERHRCLLLPNRSCWPFRSLHWVQMPQAPSIIRSALQSSGRCPSPSGAQQNVGDACDCSATTRSRPPPLSRITDETDGSNVWNSCLPICQRG